MATYYNAAQPLNIKTSGYTANDIVEFTLRTRPGRSIKAGSIRFTGKLAVEKLKLDGTYTPLVFNDAVTFNPFCGAHSLIRNISTSVNNGIVENISYYPRIVGMMKQSQYTLEKLNTDSSASTEMLGSQNGVYMLQENYEDDFGRSFSISPECALNKSSADLDNTKFSTLSVIMNLANEVEAFHTTHLAGDSYMLDANSGFSGLRYVINDFQCNWIEVQEAPAPKVVMQTIQLITQSMVTSNSFFNVSTAGLPYDAVALSFIRQANRNKLTEDNNLCEFIQGLDGVNGRLEFNINGNDRPIAFPILSYQECALNYLKSLGGSINRNSIVNSYLSKTSTFGVGASFLTSMNDRIGVALQTDASVQAANTPSDVYIYIFSYATI